MDGHVLDANANFLESTGYRHDEIVGRHYPLYREPESHHAPFRLQQQGRAA